MKCIKLKNIKIKFSNSLHFKIPFGIITSILDLLFELVKYKFVFSGYERRMLMYSYSMDR